eukprot:COSAG05_NODE_787_length_7335_cov_30.078220_4_plen_321_part_00
MARHSLILGGVAWALVGSNGQVAPHAGCGKAPPAGARPGTSTTHSLGSSHQLRKAYPSQIWPRSFELTVPPRYNTSKPAAVVLAFHGFSDAGEIWAPILGELAAQESFILVAPTGADDITDIGHEDPSDYNSWNGGGTTQVPFPGSKGRTCDVHSSQEPSGAICNQSTYDDYCSYCYASCKARPQGCKPCDWTTCNDDIVFTGLLLDWVEAHFCVNPSRVYAVGFSNGGTFVYALGQALPHRIAAIAPMSGTPMVGFEVAPALPGQSVIDVHGLLDDTCVFQIIVCTVVVTYANSAHKCMLDSDVHVRCLLVPVLHLWSG